MSCALSILHQIILNSILSSTAHCLDLKSESTLNNYTIEIPTFIKLPQNPILRWFLSYLKTKLLQFKIAQGQDDSSIYYGKNGMDSDNSFFRPGNCTIDPSFLHISAGRLKIEPMWVLGFVFFLFLSLI